VRKWAKRLAAALAIAGALLVVLALAVPLMLRGRLLAYVVERATASLCGRVGIQGGRFAVTAIFDLLFDRPTFVELEGLRVTAPDGEEVLVAARLSARVTFEINPLRVDLYDVRLTSVRWGFVEHRGEGRVDFIDAFRQVPAGASRDLCIAPRPRRNATALGPVRAPPPPAPVPSISLQVHNALLEDVSLRLDFNDWALVLEGTWAEGAVGFSSGLAGPRLTFEARGIEARRGGSLRVGRRGQRWAALVPFDHVQIDRYSTLSDAPADMVLEVGRATTGRSALSGRARFTDIFPWGRRSRFPGLDLDARWTEVGDAVEALKRAWGLSQRLPGRLDGNLTARFQGPFAGLTGRLHAAGPRAQFDLDLDEALRVDATMQLDRIETDGVLDPALAPLLGGHLSGHLRAHLQLAPEALGLSAGIDEATLRLDRRGGGPWPRRLTVSTHALPGASPADELDLFFSGARLVKGTLSLREVRASLAGAALRGTVSARLLDLDTGEPLAAPLVDASGEARGLDLARLVPGGLVHGQLTTAGEIHGPTRALSVTARFPSGSWLALGTQPLALPPRLTARLLEGERLVVAPVRLGDPASGAIELDGSVDFNGPVDARIGVIGYPLEHLPLPRLPFPLSGRIDSGLQLTGPTRQPRLAGQVAFSQMRAGTALLGDGAIELAPDGRATRFDGRLVPALGVRGRLAYAPAPSLSATVTITDLPFEPFLSNLPGLTGRVAGVAEVRAGPGNFTADAALDSISVNYQLAGSKALLAVRNSEPAHLRASRRGVVFGPVRFTGTGIDGVAEAAVDAAAATSSVRGQVALPALAEALAPWIKEAAGVVDVELHAEGPPRAPVLRGEFSVREPLRVWPRMLLVPVQLGSGRVTFQGPRLEARELALSIASVTLQLDGAARLAPAMPDTQLDVQVTGAVDGGALARRLPALLANAHGRATLAGRMGGTVGAPTFDGHADFIGFGALVPGAPVELRSLDGRIEAHGHTLSTRALSLALGPGGQLQIGTSDAPATIEVSSLDPLDVATIAVGVRGHDIATATPISGLRLQDLDLQLSLDHALGGPLRIGGEVWVDGATLAPSELRPPTAATGLRRAGARMAKELFPDILLDVGIHSHDGALVVEVPHFPDVAVTLDCRVVGSSRKPKVSGRAHGDGLYSRLAIFLYDVFSDQHVRRCGAR
jgi:hypothetical protein